MIKLVLTLVAIGTVYFVQGQNLHQNEVTSVVLNQFNVQFPKATEVEWKKGGKLYKVEFETGRDKDHDVWYNAEGEMTKHKEELSRSNLPEAIRKNIKKDFKSYKIDDVDRLTEGYSIVYKVEIEKYNHERDLFYSENGKLIK